MNRSLLVAPQWIGDAVMAQPLAAALAARGDHVTAVGLPAVAPVLRAMPGVAEVIEAPLAHGRLDLGTRRAVAARLRRAGCTHAYILGNNIKSRLIPWLARIPVRVGYRGEAAGMLLTRAVPEPRHDARPDLRAHYRALADVAHGPTPEPALHVDADAVRQAHAAFALTSGCVALCPGADYGPAKQWPLEHFGALARLAQAEGRQVMVLGGPREVAAGAAIVAAAPGVHDLTGRTPLDQAIALLAGASGVVSNDSGLMHVAAALDRPTLGLYGSTDPRHTPPAARRSATLWLHLECSPCFARTCPLGHLRCLRDITPALAWSRLQALMQPD